MNTIRRILAGAILAVAVLLPSLAVAQTTVKPNTQPKSYTTAQRDAMTCNAGRRGMLVWNTTTTALNLCDGSAWSAFVAGGGGESLDATLDIGATANITAAGGHALVVNDAATGAGQSLDINGTGIVAAAGSRNYIDISTAVAHGTTGVVRGVNVNFTGATNTGGGSFEGLQITMPATTDSAIDIPVGSITMAASGTITQTGAGGSTVYTITAGDVVWSDSSLAITDADNAASLSLTNNTATTANVATTTANALTSGSLWAGSVSTGVVTGNLVSVTANALTTGTVYFAESSDAGFAGFYFRAYDGAANDFTVGEDGRVTIAGPASGSNALAITQGDVVLTDGAFTSSAGTTTLANDQTAEAVLVVTCAGAMTEDCVQHNITSTGNVPVWDINYSGANSNAAAILWDVDITGAGAAFNVLDIDIGAIAYTGDIVNLNLGATSTTGQALTIDGGAAARTTDLVLITDSGTDSGDALRVNGGTQSGNLFRVDTGGAMSGHGVRIDYGDAATGNAVQINTTASADAAGALYVDGGARGFTDALVDVTSSTGVFTDDVIELNISGAGSGNGIDATVSAVQTGDVIQIAYSAAATGEAIEIAMANAAADAGAIDINDGARATTVDLVAITDSSTSTADSLAIAKTGAASTGSAVELTGTVVAADAADGKLLQVSYNGALVSQGGGGAAASATSVVNIEAITTAWANDADDTPSFVLNVVGAANGTAGDNDHVMRIAATGTGIEGLWVDDGTSRFDEPVTVGVSGAAAVGDSTFNQGATDALVINAASVSHTETSGALDVNYSSGTAASAAVAVNAAITAGAAAGLTAVDATIDSSGFAGGAGITGAAVAYTARLTTNNDAAETGFIGGYYAAPPSTTNAATQLFGFLCDAGYSGSNDGCIGATDDALIIREVNTAGAASGVQLVAGNGVTAGAGGTVDITAGNGTAGAGGAVTVSGGAGDAANAGGVLTLRAGTNAAGGTEANVVIRGSDDASGFEDWLVINANATPPVQVANSARPTKTFMLESAHFVAVDGSPVVAELGTTRQTAMIYDGGTDEEACANFMVPWDWDSSTAIDVDIYYTSETGTNDVVWSIRYECNADNGDLDDDAGDVTMASTTDTVAAAELLNIVDAGTDFTAAELAAVNTFCKVCVLRDANAAGDTHAADIGLLGLACNYTSIAP